MINNLFSTVQKTLTLIVIVFCSSLTADLGYYQYPTLVDDKLVFASEGDLWQVDANGGKATRLTSHLEEESRAYLSADGQWLAFMANYDDSNQVYVMPAGGGQPKQVTFRGGMLRGWTPDGKLIITRIHERGIMDRVVSLLDPESGEMDTLPLLNATKVTFVDDESLYFSRYGLETSRDNSRMYQGGTVSQLWRWNKGDKEATRLADDFKFGIREPMWRDGRVWFVTDQSGYDNLWSMDAEGKDATQHTFHDDFGVQSPQATIEGFVYQLGADIYQYRVAEKKSEMIPLEITSDQDRKRTRWLQNPIASMTSANLSADGKRVAITARGKVALAAPGKLRRIELDIPNIDRARDAAIGAKGKYMYAIVDTDNSSEIWRFSANGKGSAKVIVDDYDARIWSFSLSPDGKWLLFDDNKKRLMLVDLANNKSNLLDQDTNAGDGSFGSFAWSDDSALLAYRVSVGVRGQIKLYEVATGKSEFLTTAKYSSYAPTFSPDGKWLYFLSERFFSTSDSVWRDRTMGPSFHKRAKIYALALHAGEHFPFAVKNELYKEPKPPKKAEEKKAKKKKSKKQKPKPALTWAGIAERLYEVPVGNGDFAALAVTNSHLFVMDDSGCGPGTLKTVKITDTKPKLEVYSGGIERFQLSADKKKLFLVKPGPGNLFVVDTGPKPPKSMNDFKVRAADWRLAINPVEEWRQMFLDAWRMHRDFSFDKAMRGVDWEAVRDKLLPLVSRLGDRTELNDLLAQMAYELGILHSQLRPGDLQQDSEVANRASLGAIYKSVKGGLEINHIYQGEAQVVAERGPLTGPDIDVKIGDVLTHVNGSKVANHGQLEKALFNQAGQQTLITVKRGKKSHDAVVTPASVRAEYSLKYTDWVESRTNYVSEQANNLGYLHIRAMGGGDAANYARDFYALTEKDGLIIDVRANRGGNIDSWILTNLLRQVWAFWHFNAYPTPYGNMQQAFRGHLVVLFDQYTYSDGETFSAGFKSMNLGHSIGTRTAGAGIWLSGRNALADRGMVRIAETGQYDMAGNWIVEGWGVSPRQEVINPPVASFNGSDAQLDAAIKYLRDKIAAEPIPEMIAKPIPPVGKPAEDIN
ncbi:MAG: peptidase S41 [Enterobacterales bacterium]|nr:peptidase S41 [Enterobacterales bacterium]